MRQLSLVESRRDFDCGIVALAILLGVAYEDVYVAASQISKRLVDGMALKEIQKVAKKFGMLLKKTWKIDEEFDVGILSVHLKREKNEGHVVVLMHGIVIDPTLKRIFFSLEYYKSLRKVSVGMFLKLDG
jgi:hypothetical protein